MKRSYNVILITALLISSAYTLFFNAYASAGIDPTFNLTAKNITRYPGANGQDSIITFELYMQQTNQGLPGVNDFEFCCAQYTFRYN